MLDKGIWLLAAAILFMPVMIQESGAQQEQKELTQPQQLFETKCSQCHSLDLPRSNRSDRKGWEETVGRMRVSYGCKLTNAEAEIIVDYLTREYGK